MRAAVHDAVEDGVDVGAPDLEQAPVLPVGQDVLVEHVLVLPPSALADLGVALQVLVGQLAKAGGLPALLALGGGVGSSADREEVLLGEVPRRLRRELPVLAEAETPRPPVGVPVLDEVVSTPTRPDAQPEAAQLLVPDEQLFLFRLGGVDEALGELWHAVRSGRMWKQYGSTPKQNRACSYVPERTSRAPEVPMREQVRVDQSIAAHSEVGPRNGLRIRRLEVRVL